MRNLFILIKPFIFFIKKYQRIFFILIQPIVFVSASLLAIYIKGRELDWLHIDDFSPDEFMTLILIMGLSVCCLIFVAGVIKVLFFPKFYFKLKISQL